MTTSEDLKKEIKEKYKIGIPLEIIKEIFQAGQLSSQEKCFEDFKTDIGLFEDARDILINLKEQGVGTGDCEKIFDKRVEELTQKIKGDEKCFTWTTDGTYVGTVFYRDGKFSEVGDILEIKITNLIKKERKLNSQEQGK